MKEEEDCLFSFFLSGREEQIVLISFFFLFVSSLDVEEKEVHVKERECDQNRFGSG